MPSMYNQWPISKMLAHYGNMVRGNREISFVKGNQNAALRSLWVKNE